MTKSLTDAITQVAADTATHVTAHLREHASAAGWPDHVVDNLHVKFNGETYQVHAPEGYHEAIHNLEYGTEKSRPSAVIRKYENAGAAGRILAGSLDHHLGGLL